MPIYDYVCHHCGHRFEVIHGLHDEGPKSCPVCHSNQVRKAFAPPAIHFKGSGWAKKDRSATRPAASRKADDTGDGTSGGDDATAKPASRSGDSAGPKEPAKEAKASGGPSAGQGKAATVAEAS